MEEAFNSAEAVFRPRSVAIVGATDKGGGGWPKRILDNLDAVGRGDDVFLINPRREELWGRRCYPNFAALPGVADLAITIVPADVVTPVLAEGADHGLKAALVFAARFGEGGDAEGARRGDALRELARTRSLRLCGPNCMGTLAIREQGLFYPSPKVRNLPAGPVGVVFQSGGTFVYWLQRAAERGLGFSYAVSSGNEIDLDLADYINFMVDDPHTRVIACMVEGVRRPRAFLRAAERALGAGKPVLVVKIGRSARGAAQAASHTGALAGDDRLFDAVCRRYGIVRCHSLDDMVEQALAFAAGRTATGAAAAMACYSGGAKGLFLDYAEEEGLEVASLAPATRERLAGLIDPGQEADNPLDAGASLATAHARFGEICRVLAEDPAVGVVALQGQLPASAQDGLDPQPFRAVAEATGKPVIAISRLAQNATEFGREFQRAAGMPFIQGLPQGVRAAKALVAYAAARRRGIPHLPARAQGSSGTVDIAAELAANGVPSPESRLAATPEEAAAAAAGIGFPVALKLVSPQASHKTEFGGVRLGLRSESAVAAAAVEMTEALRRFDPRAGIEGFLVQEMADGLEVLLGVCDEPGYGPCLVLGLGGVTVEAVQDVVLRMLPVTGDEVEDAIAQLRGRKLFDAFRGRPARDVDALKRAVAGACDVFLEHRAEISDLEINPLFVGAVGEGVRAADVRLVRREVKGKQAG